MFLEGHWLLFDSGLGADQLGSFWNTLRDDGVFDKASSSGKGE